MSDLTIMILAGMVTLIAIVWLRYAYVVGPRERTLAEAERALAEVEALQAQNLLRVAELTRQMAKKLVPEIRKAITKHFSEGGGGVYR